LLRRSPFVPTKAEEIGNLLQDYGGLLLRLPSLSRGWACQIERCPARIGDSWLWKLDELKQQIEEVLEQAGKRVMVLIADIDRWNEPRYRDLSSL